MAKNQKNTDEDADEVKGQQVKEFDAEVLNKGNNKITTVVRNMKDLIAEKLAQLKDLATMEVLLDTHTRLKMRMQSIKEMSSASHIKVRGQWKTMPPQIHISNLQGRKINNDEMIITFGVFEVDAKGNKVLYEHKAEVDLPSGEKIMRTASADYRIAYEVTERIRNGKPIEREVVYLDIPKGE